MGDEHQVHVVALLVAHLLNGLQRNPVLRKHRCHLCQNARAVGHAETQVVLHFQSGDVHHGAVVGHGVAAQGRGALLNAASDIHHVAHHRGSGRTCAGALAEEHRLAHGVACDVNGVVHTVDACQLMAKRDHGRMNAGNHALAAALGDGQKLHGVAHIVGGGQIKRAQATNALGMHLIDGDSHIEADGGQDRDLGGGVEAVDIGGGVGLGKAVVLSFLERLIVGKTCLHAREHVVGGAVDDADDRSDVVGAEGVLQGTDDGDAATDGGAEAQLKVVLMREGRDILARRGHDGLVGGNHVLAVLQCLGNHVLGDAGAAEQLDNQIDVVGGNHLAVIGGEQIAQAVRLGHIGAARADARQLQVDAVARQEIIVMLLNDVDAAGANGSGTAQTNTNRHLFPPENEGGQNLARMLNQDRRP